MSDKKIIQIMPADGWCAVFDNPPGEDVAPLTAWALIEAVDDGETHRYVDGLFFGGGWMEQCFDYPDFKYFSRESELTADQLAALKGS